MTCNSARLPGLQHHGRPAHLLHNVLASSRTFGRCSFRHGLQSASALPMKQPHRLSAARRSSTAQGTRPCASASATLTPCGTHRTSRPAPRGAWSSTACSPRLRGRHQEQRQCRTQAVIETDSLVPLGLDFLTFLAATVLVIPLFKSVKASPILGFLFSGLLLGQLG